MGHVVSPLYAAMPVGTHAIDELRADAQTQAEVAQEAQHRNKLSISMTRHEFCPRTHYADL